jgi:GNAT superfamily N-acetyltransferase
LNEVEVRPAAANALSEPLKLLEEALRDGEPLPQAFAERLARNVEGRDLEVLSARAGGRLVGVAVLAFRPGVSLGADFASVEELHVRPEERGRGVGRALLAAVGERCRRRGVSYVEVQTNDEAAAFYKAFGFELEEGVRVLSRSYALGLAAT